MLNALEELRKIRAATARTAECLPPKPPTNPTEARAREPALPGRSLSSARGEDFGQSATDVLAVLVKANAPLPHTALLAALAGRGHGNAAAYKAIADVQGRGWIEHNLITGYIIAGERKGDSHVR